MIFLDVAVGPMYAIIGGTFLLIALAVAGIVLGAVFLIRKVLKNKEDKK